MAKAIIYIHGQGGNAGEAEHYIPLFSDAKVTGIDYKAEFPWEAETEFPQYFDMFFQKYDSVSIVANSIGAYFAMISLSRFHFEKAFFISPVTDMEILIRSMMKDAGITETELYKAGEIRTSSGEILSSKYLSFVKEHPVIWNTPTHIIYGGKDKLIAFDTVAAFAEKNKATLSVMENAGHWFHTKEEMDFIDNKIKFLR